MLNNVIRFLSNYLNSYSRSVLIIPSPPPFFFSEEWTSLNASQDSTSLFPIFDDLSSFSLPPELRSILIDQWHVIAYYLIVNVVFLRKVKKDDETRSTTARECKDSKAKGYNYNMRSFILSHLGRLTSVMPRCNKESLAVYDLTISCKNTQNREVVVSGLNLCCLTES